jgi:hypothetical protein
MNAVLQSAGFSPLQCGFALRCRLTYARQYSAQKNEPFGALVRLTDRANMAMHLISWFQDMPPALKFWTER